MYFLILMFWTSHGVTPSNHVIPYASRDACAVAGKDFAQYESGVENGKAKAGEEVPTVYWYCVPSMPAPGTPTT
jgi:hypothetical protein